MKTNKYIGARIREIRKEKGLTQTELSKITGLTQSVISRIEVGETTTTIEVIGVIAKALGYKLDFVIK